MDESGASVLIVDDDPALLRLVTLVLRTDGFEAHTAVDGQEALAEIARCEPDVIVLDLEMPVMDGPTFLHHIREDGNRTPVLILSALEPEAARSLDAQDFLSKPFIPDELSVRLRRLIAA
jgi:DNA-binding response OmpR family regulator